MAERFKLLLVFGALCLFSYIAVYPFLELPGWYYSHEFDRYLYLILEFRDIFESGQWYPRWASRLMNGYGYPTFIFYQPGFFYFMLPFTYLPVTLPHAFFIGWFVIFLVSAIGAYKLARLFNHDRFISTLFAVTYLFMPYAYTNLYIRGDHSEFLAMMICSWVMYAIFRLQKEASAQVMRSTWFIYIISVAGVFVSHPHVALFLVGVIGWIVLVTLLGEGLHSRFAYYLMLGGTIATTLTAPYWFTMVQMDDLVNIHRVKRTIGQSVSWIEMFTHTTPSGMSPWITTIGIINGFYVCIALLGLILVRKTRLFWQICPIMLVSIVMNTHASLPLWHAVPGTAYIQFPWRIASVAGVLIYIAMLQVRVMRARLPVPVYHGFVMLVLAASTILQPYLVYDTETHGMEGGVSWARRFVEPPPPYTPSVLHKHYEQSRWTFANHDEFTPRWLDSRALTHCINNHGSRVQVKVNSGITGKADKSLMPYRIIASIDIPEGEFTARPDSFHDLPYIIINQISFPGWIGYVNGKELIAARKENWMEKPSATKDAYGRIQIFFPRPGHYEIEAYYDGPPYWWLRNIVMVIALLAQWKLAVWLGLVKPLRMPALRRRRAS